MTLKRVFASVFFVIIARALAMPAIGAARPVAAPTGAAGHQPGTGRARRRAHHQCRSIASGLARSAAAAASPSSQLSCAPTSIVKTVMVLLLLASLWSWAIIINKWIALGGLKRKAAQVRENLLVGPVAGRALSAIRRQATIIPWRRCSWRRCANGAAPSKAARPRESQIAGIKERIDKAMNVTILRETDGIERQLGFLATVGSVAPFIGLFGTVWGIMNSFTAIAARHDTTLAVVAPGIAEALFATAMGLFAAVPAVIFYNRFINEIGRYTNRLDAFADEFSAILSRQLEEKAR